MLLERFIKKHSGQVLLAIDEAHNIKNYQAERTKVALDLGGKCCCRGILTGTPIAKNIADLFSEYKFLDEKIFGMRYFTAFRNKYCETRHNGFALEIVGAKNLEQLYAKIDPFTFRATKDELDLPPKVYDERQFEMSAEQARHYKELKQTFLTQLSEDETLSVVNVASAMMKLQQITCGYIKKSDGSFFDLPNPRLETLKDILDDGQTIIWARFNRDIEKIMEMLGSSAVSYYGPTSEKDRQKNKELFLNKEKQFFVSNPAAGGTGLNLQGACRTAIYYSNSFNAVERWQSEDRIHRIGTTSSVTYIDLVCRKSIDSHILKNLLSKKSLSNMAIDEIRLMFK
jgi:SNF2 family DNA or RNA helicase